MEIKVSEATPLQLDWMVGQCEGALFPLGNLHRVGRQLYIGVGGDLGEPGQWVLYTPSTDWSQGGPIIEREGIELLCNLTAIQAARFKDCLALPDWQAFYRDQRPADQRSFAVTPLIAAMRCRVRRKLGEEVDIPDELIGNKHQEHSAADRPRG